MAEVTAKSKWYVTFPQRLDDRKDKFAVIEVESDADEIEWQNARNKAFELLGQEWAFIYSEEEWTEATPGRPGKDQAEQYGLTELK